MTTNRDRNTVLLRAYLDEGVNRLSDRVVDAVLDEVHRTRQRAQRGSWRTRPMFKLSFATAAVVAVIAVGIFALGILRPQVSVGGPSPSPSANAPTATTLSSTGPSAPVYPDFPRGQNAPLSGTYFTDYFRDPLTITMPDLDAPGESLDGSVWSDRNTIHILGPFFGITLQASTWRSSKDICNPTIETQRLPATPAAVRAWLRGTDGIQVADWPSLTVDGREALVFDVTIAKQEFCSALSYEQPPDNVAPWFGNEEVHRFIAMPSPGGTVLLVTWPAGQEVEEVNAFAQDLATSIDFR